MRSHRSKPAHVAKIIGLMLAIAGLALPAAGQVGNTASGTKTGTGTQRPGVGVGNAGQVTPRRLMRPRQYVPGQGDRATRPAGVHRRDEVGFDDAAADRWTTRGGTGRRNIYDTQQSHPGRAAFDGRSFWDGRADGRIPPISQRRQAEPTTYGRGYGAPSYGVLRRIDAEAADEVPAAQRGAGQGRAPDLRMPQLDTDVPLELLEEFPTAPLIQGDEIPAALRPEPLSDNQVETLVMQRIKSDPFIEPNDVEDIGVRAMNGSVEVAGRVSSPAVRRRVLDAALVPGVESIDASQLSIAPPPQLLEFREQEIGEEPLSDEAITQSILRAYYLNRRVDPRTIHVHVEEGVVTLSGVLLNAYAKNAAVEIARDAPGVKSVVNRLIVGPIADLVDIEIADGIRDAIVLDPYLERYEVGVAVNNRRARLFGSVSSYEAKERAEEIADSVSGVWGVDNELIVDPDDSPVVTYETLAALNLLRQAPYYEEELALLPPTDEEIQTNVMWELAVNPRVNATDIQVEVRDRVAVLTGWVESWAARRNATLSAFAGGAEFVENRLSVR